MSVYFWACFFVSSIISLVWMAAQAAQAAGVEELEEDGKHRVLREEYRTVPSSNSG